MIDAGGCLVLPGAIDVHTHVFGSIHDHPRSALRGGTTSALAFVDALAGESPAEACRRTLADEMPDSMIDLAFHAVIWEPQAYRSGDLRTVAEMGVGSVKLWLAYLDLGIMADDDVAFAVMQEAAELGMVTLAHCENGRVIDVLTRQLAERGELGLESLPRSRPIELEAECVHRFLVMAELAGVTPYVVHVTGREPLAEIVAARARGMTVHGEVCMHHMLFEVSDHLGADAMRYVLTPPLRSAADRAVLFDALQRRPPGRPVVPLSTATCGWTATSCPRWATSGAYRPAFLASEPGCRSGSRSAATIRWQPSGWLRWRVRRRHASLACIRPRAWSHREATRTS